MHPRPRQRDDRRPPDVTVAVTLTGYGGVGEIGGNAFLLDDGKTRLFLDLGKRFGSDPRDDSRRPGWNDYYDDFLQPRGATLVPDLMRLGIIPDVPTLWRQDRGGVAGPRPVDGVIVSHAHMDHCGLVSLLRPDIPILASAASRATLASMQETGSGVMTEFLTARPKGILPKKDGTPGKGTNWTDADGPVQVARDWRADGGDIGAWKLRHFDVDHSIHGARATLLEGPMSIAYTGDFRMHGRDAAATKRLVERAGGVDVLVAEGTRVSRTQDGHGHGGKETDDEHAVEGEIQAALDRHKEGFVAVSFPPRDLDRLISVWHVARSSGRRLAVPAKLAHLIDTVRASGRELPDPRRDPSIAIHVPVKGRGVRGMPPGTLRMPKRDLSVHERIVDDETWSDFWLADHDAWEHPYVTSENAVTSAEVAAAPHAFLFAMSYWTISELFDIFPIGSKPGGLYIHSMTQPFNDDMIISDRKLRRWLKVFGLERVDTHVSGHLSEKDLHWVLDEIGARRLVPIHSQAPDLTASKYQDRTGHKALLPEWGKALALE